MINPIKAAQIKARNWYWNVLRAPKDFSDATTDILQCAQWSNDEVGRITGKRPYGDAWTRTNNKVTSIINGYEGLQRPEQYNESEVQDYTFKAAENVKHGLSRKMKKNLQDGDMVGLYFRTSPNWETAYNNGSNGETQTHTGHIVKEGNKVFVEHNVHGDIVKNRLRDVLGRKHPWGVVSIYRINNE